ncbi:hypothetical protein I3271_09050 [Photobacterium leiognathi]|uniref:hypothetical protein n=1 Tax=Photobacterium leiognathi TaxID=553611 RepID=UPI001EDE88B8|nr:hypothetical protein [Photobacterium leiognathi]MCG3884835.1 hypothetical protein [Photobacterium leiognathi]
MRKHNLSLLLALLIPTTAFSWTTATEYSDKLAGYTIYSTSSNNGEVSTSCYVFDNGQKSPTINFNKNYPDEKISFYYGNSSELSIRYSINDGPVKTSEGYTYTEGDGFYLAADKADLVELTKAGTISLLVSEKYGGSVLLRKNVDFDADKENNVALVAQTCGFDLHLRKQPAPIKTTKVEATEGTILSCPLKNGKLAAVYLSDNIPYYMYGKNEADTKPELILPKKNNINNVAYSRLTFSGGGALYYRFTNGNYDYVVYTGEGKGWKRNDVTVYKNDKKIAQLECAEPFTSEINYNPEGKLKNDSETGDFYLD